MLSHMGFAFSIFVASWHESHPCSNLKRSVEIQFITRFFVIFYISYLGVSIVSDS